jgi:hypothetical protein
LALSSVRAAAAAAAIVAALVAAPLASAAPPTDSSALRAAVTPAGILQHQNAFQTIGTANGGTRASGTPGYDASLAYMKAQLEDKGYYDVTVQPFRFDPFRELATPVFQRISPDPRSFVANQESSRWTTRRRATSRGRSWRPTTS